MATRHFGRFFPLAIIGALVAGLLAACAAAPTVTGGWPAPPSAPVAAPAPAPAAPAPVGSGFAGDSALSRTAESVGTANLAAWNRMIIRTANLTLTVENVEDALAASRRLATTAGGFVAQSTTRYEGERMIATLTLQVPATQFDAVIQELRRIAKKVEVENVSSQDVTEEFIDLQAQLINLQATEAQLRGIMERATRVEDILAIQRELTQVRNQIERIRGRMNFLQQRADFSSISLTLYPPGVTVGGDSAWDPIKVIEQAWAASLRVLRAVASAILMVVVFFWWLVPLAVLTWPLWRLLLSRRRAATPPPNPSA